MQFLKVEDWHPGILALSQHLRKELKTGKKMLWLVSGGSNVGASVAVMEALPEELTPNLAVLLIDERYGTPGHKDSNFKQLLDAGFQHKQATFMPVLAEGLNLQETAQRYEELLGRALEYADIIIAQLGIGADGHIAGILPHSSAVNTSGLVWSYEHPPYRRITATFEALKKIDCDYSFVFGEDKLKALQNLQTTDLPLDEQPAQMLKQLPKAYIYNDQVGEEKT